jgi:hypothetical protein
MMTEFRQVMQCADCEQAAFFHTAYDMKYLVSLHYHILKHNIF